MYLGTCSANTFSHDSITRHERYTETCFATHKNFVQKNITSGNRNRKSVSLILRISVRKISKHFDVILTGIFTEISEKYEQLEFFCSVFSREFHVEIKV